MVPADAEIVIEGLIDPDLLEPEGPFGESHGHIALEDFNMSMQVTAITQQARAGVRLDRQPGDAERIERAQEGRDGAAVPRRICATISASRASQRVVLHEPLSNLRKVIFVQYAQGTPRTEVWRGLQGASSLLADCGKICIAVSEDIDPSNADAVFWSLAYRANPIEDAHIAPHRSARTRAEVRPAPRGIDAADRRDAQAHRAAARAAGARLHGAARARSGRNLQLPAITPQPPWHGYSLGDWSRPLGRLRRTRGRRPMGAERRARLSRRRRGGLTPETPVREVEGK